MNRKHYKKYKTSDVLLVSQFHWPQMAAMELGKRMRKFVLYLPTEVDDVHKAFNSISYPQLEVILKQMKRNYVKLKKI